MKKLLLCLLVSLIPASLKAGSFYTINNPWTGKPDYISSNTVNVGGGGSPSVGSVIVVHSNASTTTYTPSSNSDIARGTALLSALSAISAKDKIYLSANTFNVGTTGINTGVPFSILGMGMNETKLISENGGGNAIVLASSSTIADLTFEHRFADYVNGIYTSNAKNILLRNVRIYQGTDPVWFDNSSIVHMQGCEVLGSIVGVQAFNNSVLYVDDSYIEANQDNDLVGNTNNDAAVLANWGGVVVVSNSMLYSGGGTNSSAVHVSNGNPPAQIYLFNDSITSNGSVTSSDLDNSSTGDGIFVSSNTIYDPSKTSGVITTIPLIPTSSGGGPTIPSTFTWTLPYGVFTGSSVVSVGDTATNALDIWQGGSIYIPFYGTVYVDHGNGVRFMSNDGTQVFGYINGTGLSVGGSSVSASGLTLATGGGNGNVNNIANLNFLDATTQTTAWTGAVPSTITLSQLNGSTWAAQTPIGKDFIGGNTAAITGTVRRGDGFIGVYSSTFIGNASNYLRNDTSPALVNSARTLSYWTKTSSANAIGASLGTTQTNNALWAATFQSASTWDLYAKGGGANDVIAATTSVNAIDGAWHHIALAYDGTSRTDLFVDGVLAGVARRASGSYATSAGVMIGVWRDLNRPFSGLVDDVGVWNVHLTTAQIQSLYNGGAGNKADTITTNLQSYYSFEYDTPVSSITINSDWINANHSTITANVVYSTGGVKSLWLEASSATFSGKVLVSSLTSQGTITSTSGVTTSTINLTYGYATSSFTVGSLALYTYTETIDAPFASEWDDPAGTFPDEGYCFNFSVRPYKTILGTRIYSPNNNPFGMCDGGTFSTNYWVYLSWSNPGSAEGYILTVDEDAWNGYYGDAYFDINAASFAEFFYDLDGGLVVGTPPSTPQSLTVISTASYVRGHQTVQHDLAVGGNAKVTGTINSSSTITGATIKAVTANASVSVPQINITNSNASGQNVVTQTINTRNLSTWRTDYLGGISWAAGSNSYGNTYRGYHDFYVSGDYPGGTKPLTLRNPYSCNDGTDSVNGCMAALMASGTDNGYSTFDFDHRFLYSKKKGAWLFAPGGETTSTTTFNAMLATVTVEGTGYVQSTFTVSGALVSSSGTLNTPYFISLSTDVRDYRPAFSGVYVASASLPVNITGIGSPRDGELLRIINVSTQTISFVNQSTWSAQFNRIALSTSSSPVYISSGQTFYAIWESFTKLWRQQ